MDLKERMIMYINLHEDNVGDRKFEKRFTKEQILALHEDTGFNPTTFAFAKGKYEIALYLNNTIQMTNLIYDCLGNNRSINCLRDLVRGNPRCAEYMKTSVMNMFLSYKMTYVDVELMVKLSKTLTKSGVREAVHKILKYMTKTLAMELWIMRCICKYNATGLLNTTNISNRYLLNDDLHDFIKDTVFDPVKLCNYYNSKKNT